MQYDVFISYSRKDMAAADALCRALDGAGVHYWIDRNIHGSANFLTEITRYIKQCKALLFIASANSAKSEFTQKEILFALKHGKQIVPYRIGKFNFADNDELDFVFTNVQWKDSQEDVIDALDKLGLVPEKQTEEEEVVALRKRIRIPRWVWGALAALVALVGGFKMWQAQGYNVGDYYEEDDKKGVVFWVDWTHRHGKIVGLTQCENELQWCTNEEYDRETNTGATDRKNGFVNQQKIMQIEGWREKYPAFAWCADQGKGWYLPAIDEAKALLLDDRVRGAVNRILYLRDGTVISNGWFWTSTEFDEFCAWSVSMIDGSTYGGSKCNGDSVRAVSAF